MATDKKNNWKVNMIGILTIITLGFTAMEHFFGYGKSVFDFAVKTSQRNDQYIILNDKVDTLMTWRTIDKKSNEDFKEFLKDALSKQLDNDNKFKQKVIQTQNEQNK